MLAGAQLGAMITPGFRFVVSVNGAPIGAFTECTLPAFDLDVETVKEGGLNTYVHQLPGQRRAAKITLKNGVGVGRDLLAFYQAAMDERFRRLEVTVSLLNPLFVPILVLHLRDAFPLRWDGPQLRSEENTVAIQTFELACGEIMVL
jgi:phage tail-like protein